MKKKSVRQKKTAGTPKKKKTGEAIELGKWLAGFRTEKLEMSRLELATMLGVDRSAVRSWENGDFQPSAESLIKLADQVDLPLAYEVWEKAGIDVRKLMTPGGSGAVRLTLPLFPFAAGDEVEFDSQETGPWALLDQPVVVEFTKYPERQEVELSQRWMDERRGTLAKVDLVESEKQHLIERQRLEQNGSEEALRKFDAADAAAEELAKRWTPDEHGMIRLEGAQAGWLRFEVAGCDDPGLPRMDWPETHGRPWRLVLQGASVRGLAARHLVQLTEFEKGSANREDVKLLEGMRIKGRVCCWRRRTGLQEAGPDPDPTGEKGPK